MTLEELIQTAKDCGFDEVNVIDTQTLTPMEMVRDACKENKCGAYDSNWGCPPHGSAEEDEKLLKSYKNGLILQCIGRSEKRIDRKMYAETGQRLNEALRKFTDVMRKEYPKCLSLGAGGCKVCEKCAKPEPCRFPEKSTAALEGYGIFITRLCQDNNVLYYYGEKTIAYNAALLW